MLLRLLQHCVNWADTFYDIGDFKTAISQSRVGRGQAAPELVKPVQDTWSAIWYVVSYGFGGMRRGEWLPSDRGVKNFGDRGKTVDMEPGGECWGRMLEENRVPILTKDALLNRDVHLVLNQDVHPVTERDPQ